ncbi:kinesin-associated protein [Achlya hypogyna]|uniref:Kinesin-associated protein n=1 Tax=Achlya hypogyna TaxID=1202772 RepID=A0A1V9Z0Y1_ACHHY|nr:kinesin-associated protein [Achlya hypogyna]
MLQARERTRDLVTRCFVNGLGYRVSAIYAPNVANVMRAKWTDDATPALSNDDTRQWAEYMAGATMLSSFFKGEERVNMTLKNSSRQLQIEAMSVGEVRGFNRPLAAMDAATGVFEVDKILYGRAKPYKTILSTMGNAQADWQMYYDVSEQVPTIVKIESDVGADDTIACCGITVQELPQVEKPSPLQDRLRLFEALDMLEMVQSEGMLSVLNVLFPEVAITAADCKRMPVDYYCRCSKERFAGRLHQLPLEDLHELAAEGGVSMSCNYCNAAYFVDAAEVEGIAHTKANPSSDATNVGSSSSRKPTAAVESRKESSRQASNLDDLDTYMELLYEESIESKLHGVTQILNLSEYGANIEVLIQNEALMSLLSRVLNDEYKKSYDFSLNMMRIFWCYSNFLQLHPILSNYRIGAITLKIVDFEVKRHELRLEEERALERTIAEQQNNGSEADAVAKLKAEKKKNKKRLKKQDQLLYVCLSVLFNLAEDIHTERKMVKKKVVHFLAKMLDRVTPDLVILTIGFLKKLSVFEENKDAMIELQVPEKVIRYVKCNHDKTAQIALKLLFNLSWDARVREAMVKNSLVPSLVELLKKPPFRALTLRLLYHLSMDDRCKSMFTYTEAIPIVMQLVINFPQNIVAKELMALAVNLSINARNAEMMTQTKGLEALVQRVLRTRDVLLMKCIRNISQWSYSVQEELTVERNYKFKGLWAPYIVPLMELAQGSDNHDLVVEILGTLGNMTPNDLPAKTTWDKLLTQSVAVIPFLSKLLVRGFSQDDVVLQVIMFVSALMLEPKCAPLITSSRIVRSFHLIFQDKQSDCEMTLQLLFCFYRMLRHPETLDDILYGCNMLSDLLLAADSPNNEVRRMCDAVLDVIIDHDIHEGEVGEFGRQIRRRRFEIHNAEYLSMLHHHDGHDDDNGMHLGDDPDDDRHHQDDDYHRK